MCIYIYMYVCVYIYIYIYIQDSREHQPLNKFRFRKPSPFMYGEICAAEARMLGCPRRWQGSEAIRMYNPGFSATICLIL